MNDEKYYKRTIYKEELMSNHLKEQRTLRVYVPPGYNDFIHYPVIYCQDGEQFFNFGRIATLATRLILDEDMEPMIIVGVDVNTERRTDDYSPDGARSHAYSQFFVDEMLPYIENKYSVRRTVEDRILAGDSLGATVSLHLALRHPDLFCHVLSLSGAFLQSTQEEIAAHADLSWLRIYQLIGLEESQVKTERGVFDFLEANRRVHRMLIERGAEVAYREKHGEHLWGFWQKELPEALNLVFG